ncbi:MAG: type 4a pilus biogenesis protein PilO [Bdellovibrionota bacterium]|nr:MAG: type 4a pilus biogenesis protein PilO [Bdellovibrionota bacterium]
MHPALESLANRPRGQRLAILIGTILVVGFLFWQYSLSPTVTAHEELGVEVERLRSKVTQETRIARNLEKYKAEVRALNEAFDEALKELPDKREIPDLLQSVNSLARDAGLEIEFFQPRPEGIRDFYAEVPVSISVGGTYHQVAAFFDEVGQMQRIINIGDIAIANPVFKEDKEILGVGAQLESIPLKTTCTATTFRFLDESERPKVGEGKDAKGGRKRGKKATT